MNGATKLRLRAQDEEDLTVIASCLQDALVPVGDIAYLPEDKRFAFVANRFCWENRDANERVNCGISFEGVEAVRSHEVDAANCGALLELLTISVEEGAVLLVFAGGGLIRLETGTISCFAEDIGEPWPTSWRPHHEEGRGSG